MNSDWAQTTIHKLGDLVNFATGKIDSNHAVENGSFPFFTCSPRPLKINLFAFDEDAILLAGNNANGIFHIHRYHGKFNAYQRTYVITAKSTILDLDYLYFWLELRLNYLRDISQGSATKFLTKRILGELEIKIPTLEIQKAIAKILSDLDAKIELNQKMDKTLEAIAQTIFKHWFINFEFPNEEGKPYKSNGGEMVYSEMGEIPKGWQVKYFKDIVNLTMGVSPTGNSYNTDGFGVPLLNGAADFSNGMIEPKKFTTNPVKTCKEGDLLFCIRATIGNLTYSDKEYCIGRGVSALSPINKIFKEYSYFTLEYGLKDLISKASGSVIRGLSKDDIFLYKVLVPSDKIMAEFHLLVSSMFSRIQYLKFETHSLSNLRDSLLPKLMSGKIRVPVED